MKQLCVPLAVVGVSLLVPIGANAQSEIVQHAIGKDGCGLDHGYVCMEPVESDFIGLEADRKMISGNYLKAWQVAWTEFKADSDQVNRQQNLKDFKIGFSENPTQYVVHIQALLLPIQIDDASTGVSRGTLGRTARYWINKQTMTVEKRLFYK